MRKIQIAISSYLSIRLTRNLTGSFRCPQRIVHAANARSVCDS